MSFSSAAGRTQLLSEVAAAIEALGRALAGLSDAYEWLDEQMADRLEEEVFRPVGSAFGLAQRTYADFAARSRLTAASFPQATTGGRPGDARAAVERAAAELEQADLILSTLQDSMLPVEVGDQELRAGLSGVRETISPLPTRARELLRRLGR